MIFLLFSFSQFLMIFLLFSFSQFLRISLLFSFRCFFRFPYCFRFPVSDDFLLLLIPCLFRFPCRFRFHVSDDFLLLLIPCPFRFSAASASLFLPIFCCFRFPVPSDFPAVPVPPIFDDFSSVFAPRRRASRTFAAGSVLAGAETSANGRFFLSLLENRIFALQICKEYYSIYRRDIVIIVSPREKSNSNGK